MTLGIGDIVATAGVLLGLNYVALFIAAYLFDRSARHLLWYLAGAGAFIGSSAAYVMTEIAPFHGLFFILDDVLVCTGFLLVSKGICTHARLPLPGRIFALTAIIGAFVIAVLAPLGELSLMRLATVSLFQVALPVMVVVRLYRLPAISSRTRFLATMLCAVILSVLIRPLVAAWAVSHGTLSPAEQAELYGTYAATPFAATLFAFAGTIFFLAMSDLAATYRQASMTDSLTGLLNRRGFLDEGNRLAARPAALIMLDIDHFKTINDTHGHDQGDRVIAGVGSVIAVAAPRPHLCGRLGGEEFAILVTRTELPVATALAQAIRVSIETELRDIMPDDRPVTASLGVAAIGDDGIAGALIAADHALYDSKEAGRNRVTVAGAEHVHGHASRRGGRRSA
ncbi:GGDEF domain-containing protein [Oceaniradius stylonematis]|uniref:diguanylate cyclase n=1 Tax=Oceaniradius stylonematis TaxID=2184161 RepID=A0A3A8AEE4_9HYPH|nr:GGDEF domain-containing protein [Oceaniradius stylonematis]RKF07419.1 GGDEF domain-containing protein [Oceaniradius stylonematis]